MSLYKWSYTPPLDSIKILDFSILNKFLLQAAYSGPNMIWSVVNCDHSLNKLQEVVREDGESYSTTVIFHVDGITVVEGDINWCYYNTISWVYFSFKKPHMASFFNLQAYQNLAYEHKL